MKINFVKAIIKF